MKTCSVCGLPSDSLSRGRCVACVLTRDVHRFRFFDLSNVEKTKALAQSLIVVAIGWALMMVPIGLVWDIGFLTLCLGLVTFPLVFYFGGIDW